jgi:hypothetical protein
MVQWLSIIVSPLVFLTNLSIVYALVPVACETQRTGALHLSNAMSLAFAVMASLFAWRALRGVEAPVGAADDDISRRQFLSRIGMWVSALVALAIALQWSAQWLLAPCIA